MNKKIVNKKKIRKQNDQKVKESREFEELVATLEKELSETSVEVKSPDNIYDKVAEEYREVDVSLRHNIDSSEILTAIECRYRKRKQGIEWIEQIATKRDDIGANNAIAVSSKGFSNGARKKAYGKNIELRTLGEIDPKEIVEWFQPTGLEIQNKSYNLLKATIIPDESLDSSQIKELHEFIKSFSGAFPRDTKFIVDSEFDSKLSVDDFISGNINKLFEILKPVEERVTTQVILSPQPHNKEAALFVSTHTGLIKIKGIIVTLEIWLEVGKAKITSASSYENEKTSFAQIVLFEDINICGVKKSYKIHRMLKGDIQCLDFYVKDLD